MPSARPDPLTGTPNPRQIVHVESAFPGQQWCRQKNPQMAPAFAHFQGRFHLVLPELVLQFQQVLHGVLVIRIDGDPFAPLRLWVDGV